MSKTVLVIEDNQDNREIILEFLSAYGFDVLPAVDGQQGIDLFRTKRPDIVLCDVLLPKVNGFGVCEAIKSDPKKVPVVLMSALYKTHALQAEAKEKYGADDYLLKPLNLVRTADKLCKLLGVTKQDLEEQAAKEKVRVDIPDSGSFKDFAPFYVLAKLFRDERTGILSCKNIFKKTVYINEGQPIYVNSDNPDETYAAMLVADGKLTDATREEFETSAKTGKTTFSKILLMENVLSSKELADYMIREVKGRFKELISWDAGTFRFIEDKTFLEKIKRPKMCFPELLYAGLKEADVAMQVNQYFAQVMNEAIQKNEERLILVAEMDMEMEDLSTFALIDGEKSINDLVGDSDQPTEGILRLVFCLVLLGIVQI